MSPGPEESVADGVWEQVMKHVVFSVSHCLEQSFIGSIGKLQAVVFELSSAYLIYHEKRGGEGNCHVCPQMLETPLISRPTAGACMTSVCTKCTVTTKAVSSSVCS